MVPVPVFRWVFCNYEFPPIGGGGGTCSYYLAKELAALGHKVRVVTAAYGDLPREEDLDGFHVTRLRAKRALPGQSNPREMVSYALAAFWHLLMAKEMPDLLLSFHSIPSGMPAWPVSVLRKVPHIVHFQGGDVPGWLPGELEAMHRRSLWLNRAIVHQSAAALANSNGLAALAQPSFPRKRIGVLRGGVDPERFPAPDRRLRADAACRLLFAGRLTTQKGLDVLLKSLGRVAREAAHLEWKLDVAGDGPRRAEFEALAASEGIAERVAFHGFLARERVRELYAEADVFAFPSRFEGMPNVVLEAMASGLPIIGTRIAGTEELVEDGVNGVLLAVDDLDACAGACLRFVANTEERRTMGEASRRLVLEKWTWAQRARELAAIAEGILRGRPQGDRP